MSPFEQAKKKVLEQLGYFIAAAGHSNARAITESSALYRAMMAWARHFPEQDLGLPEFPFWLDLVDYSQSDPDKAWEAARKLQSIVEEPYPRFDLEDAAAASWIEFNATLGIVTFRGKKFHIKPRKLILILELLKTGSEDDPIPASRLRALHGCRTNEKQFRRWLGRLPKPILACVQSRSGGGGGRWLQPPKKR